MISQRQPDMLEDLINRTTQHSTTSTVLEKVGIPANESD